MEFNEFSIVIPAHNEEKGIVQTLRKIINSNYPKEHFEVIVTENGSSDKTLKKAKSVKSPVLKVYSTKKKGISFAKNFGASKASKKTKWLLFVDADTHISRSSLSEINDYLIKNKNKNLTIGTTNMDPRTNDIKIKLWYKFIVNIVNRFGSSSSLQIVRRDLFDKTKYDENLKLLEDYDLINKLKKLGKFFFIPIYGIDTSMRRFHKVGLIGLNIQWLVAAFVPYSLRKKMGYGVVR